MSRSSSKLKYSSQILLLLVIFSGIIAENSIKNRSTLLIEKNQIPVNQINVNGGTSVNYIPLVSNSLTKVDPISINDSEDWANYDFITGNGTPEDPYIIENIEILGTDYQFDRDNASSYGIIITDDSASFIIQQCHITGFHIGIYILSLEGESLDVVENNQIEHCGIGIFFQGDNLTISENSISECRALPQNRKLLTYMGNYSSVIHYGGAGIYVGYAFNNVTIESNTVRDSDVGISVGHIAEVTNNHLFGCGFLFDLKYLMVFEGENQNTVNDLPLGIFGGDNYKLAILDGNEKPRGQIIVVGCNNTLVKNFNIQDTTVGLLFAYNTNITLQNITATDCLLGMLFLENGSLTVEGDQQSIGYIHTEEVAFISNNIGLQVQIGGTMENTLNDVNFVVQEFTDNDYDVVLGVRSFSGHTFTFPKGTKINIDDYLPFQVKATYNNQNFIEITNTTSSFDPNNQADPSYSQVDMTLNDEGTYIISLREALSGSFSGDFTRNLTIIIKDFPKLDQNSKIPGYSLPMLFIIGVLFFDFQLVMVKKKSRGQNLK